MSKYKNPSVRTEAVASLMNIEHFDADVALLAKVSPASALHAEAKKVNQYSRARCHQKVLHELLLVTEDEAVVLEARGVIAPTKAKTSAKGKTKPKTKAPAKPKAKAPAKPQATAAAQFPATKEEAPKQEAKGVEDAAKNTAEVLDADKKKEASDKSSQE